MEKSQFRFGKQEIDFTIQRSPRRRKTVSIIVDPNDGVLLKSPSHVCTDTLRDIAYGKGAWIIQKLRLQCEDSCTLPEREFITGESVQYLGRNYILKVIYDPILRNGGFCRLKGKYLECVVSDKLDENICLEAIKRWYFERAKIKLEERVKYYSNIMSLTHGGILLREQKKRWASCDAEGNLRFNWQLIMAPLKLVDYIVVHELAHLRIRNHSPAFWRLVSSVLPDYEDRKEKLRKLGVRLSIIKKLDQVDVESKEI